nr:NADH dehydrogenase subunit 5 [Oxylipeurus chiniri]
MFQTYPYSVTLVFDKSTFSFLLMASIVSFLVFTYSYGYMDGEKEKVKFHFTLFLFVVSMVILSVSSDLFWTMIGWDGLGLSSMCLIFYFPNHKSFNSSMITFMLNRVGDCLLLFIISFLSMVNWPSQWISFPFFCLFPWFLILCVGACSKSAQTPFSSWLTEAMAAPTPVSSLVHSSTLVTAGIFMIVRFHSQVSENSFFFLSLLSLCTLFVASSSSIFEFDFKKIIALSTMTHISLILFFLSFGHVDVALFHMTTHAFFKSLLFMSAGYLIHLESGEQDIRKLFFRANREPAVILVFYLSILSMMGIPFLSGFYSKECFLYFSESSWIPEVNFIPFFCLFLGAFATCAYSVRLLLLIQKMSRSSFGAFSKLNFFFRHPFLAGSFLSIFGGSIVNVYFLHHQVLGGPFIRNFKIFLFFMMFLGMCIGAAVAIVNPHFLMKAIFSYMWHSASFVKIFISFFYYFSSLVFNFFDVKGWLV